MGRGLISGVIWGALLSLVAVALLSLGMPLPDGVSRPAPTAVSSAEQEPVIAPEAAEQSPAATAPETATASGPQLQPPAAPQESAASGTTAPISEIVLPAGSEFNRPADETAPVLPGLDSAPAGAPAAVTALPQPTAPPLPDTQPAPQPQAVASVESPAAAPASPEPVAAPSNAGGSPLPQVAAEEPAALGLPQIETGPEAETETAPLGRPLQPIEPAEQTGDMRAIDRFAAPFDAAETRPLMAVILIDDPSFPLGRDALTRFEFPVAFAIDPRRPDAAEAAAAYRAAGFEVLLSGAVFTEDVTGADVSAVLARGFATLPEAVGVLDTAGEAIQGRREVLEAVVETLAESGHGLVAFPRGLNVAEQTATRATVPAATLFREIDSEQERATVITRYLDRAAFAAGQEGAVIVVGHTYSDTVTALFSWALGNRSEAVALAPLSAVLTR